MIKDFGHRVTVEASTKATQKGRSMPISYSGKLTTFILLLLGIVKLGIASAATAQSKIAYCHGCSEAGYEIKATTFIQNNVEVFVLDVLNENIKAYKIRRRFDGDATLIEAISQTVPSNIENDFREYVIARNDLYNELFEKSLGLYSSNHSLQKPFPSEVNPDRQSISFHIQDSSITPLDFAMDSTLRRSLFREIVSDSANAIKFREINNKLVRNVTLDLPMISIEKAALAIDVMFTFEVGGFVFADIALGMQSFDVTSIVDEFDNTIPMGMPANTSTFRIGGADHDNNLRAWLGGLGGNTTFSRDYRAPLQCSYRCRPTLKVLDCILRCN